MKWTREKQATASTEPESASNSGMKAEPAREPRRRRKEMIMAAIAGFFALAFLLVQMFQIGSGQVFLALFNLNVVILLGIIFVVLRNGLKLLLERRRGVLGSHLRTRLVLSFTTMTLVPCLLMFLVTAQFVKQSFDFWFKNQIETSMDTALEIGRNAYDKAGKRLRLQSEHTLKEIRERRFVWGGQGMKGLLENKNAEYDLALIGVLTPDLEERSWLSEPNVGNSWRAVKNSISWATVHEQGYVYMMGHGPSDDFMYGILAVDNGKTGYLVLCENMGAGFKEKLDRIVAGTGEYKNLRNIKRPLKSMLYVTLGVLTSLITMGTIWFAFRVAKELSAPIMALVEATEKIATGDLNVKLDERATDELGLLVKSFNSMAEELRENRRELTGANALLENQNTNLIQHRQYIETVLNNITAGVATFDPAWKLSTVNNAACRMFNMTPEEVQQREVTDFLPPHYAPMVTEIGRKLRRRPDAHIQHQFTLHAKGNDLRLLLTIVSLPYVNGEPQGCVAVFEDITELEKMQRMSAWREVAKRIAHEIKNPLTPIKLSAQRLERKFSAKVGDPVFTQSTQLIVREVEHLQSMVQEFSTFAKIPEVKPVTSDLRPFLQELVQTFNNSHSGINWQLLVNEPEEGLPPVLMDKNAMHRAMLNIMTNAAEALEGRENPEVKISAWYLPETDMARVEVSDNGPGLSEEERKQIFEPYFTRKKSGTGLGLTIVKSIIADHNGYIQAGKNAEGGLYMAIDIPVAG